MKEKALNLLCKWLTKKTEDAYLAGMKEEALVWSQRLDKVIFQLLLIKNQYLFDEMKSNK